MSVSSGAIDHFTPKKATISSLLPGARTLPDGDTFFGPRGDIDLAPGGGDVKIVGTTNISSLTPSSLVATDASLNLVSVDPSTFLTPGGASSTYLTPAKVLGTADQVIVTTGYPGDPITLSTPQNIGTGADVRFASATINGLTATSLVATDSKKVLTSSTSSLTPSFTNITASALTASSLVATDASKALTSNTSGLTPTFTNITPTALTASSLVATDSAKSLTSSTSGLSPTFTNITASALNASSLVATTGSKSLTSDTTGLTPTFTNITPTALSASSLVATDSKKTLSTDTTAISPTFSGLTVNGVTTSNAVVTSVSTQLADKNELKTFWPLCFASEQTTGLGNDAKNPGTMRFACGGVEVMSMTGGYILPSVPFVIGPSNYMTITGSVGGATGLMKQNSGYGALGRVELAVSGTDYELPLTFSSPLSRASQTISLGVVTGSNGGTGVNNGTKTITLGGNLTTSGAFNTTLTVTGATNVTLPTSGTLLTGNQTITLSGDISGSGSTAITTTIGAGKVTNAMLAGTIPVNKGGTGQTSFTNGQLLIGNTSTSGLSVGTLTGSPSLSVASGAGTITLDTIQAITTSSLPTFQGTLLTKSGSITTTDFLQMGDTSQLADNKYWGLGPNGTHLYGYALTDSKASSNWLDVARSGSSISSITLNAPTNVNGTFVIQSGGSNKGYMQVSTNDIALVSISGAMRLYGANGNVILSPDGGTNYLWQTTSSFNPSSNGTVSLGGSSNRYGTAYVSNEDNSGSLTLSGTGASRLVFANTTAQNRHIELYRVANNDHQYLGFGVNSGALRYQVADTATDHVWYAGTSTTASQEIMRVRGTGPVTAPLNPSFNAYVGSDLLDVTGNGTTYTIIFNTKQHDTGSNFNTTTGAFTAPVTGRYYLHACVGVKGLVSASNQGNVAFVVNGASAIARVNNNPYASADPFTLDNYYSISTVYQLTANDVVTVTIQVSGTTKVVDVKSTQSVTYFCGNLLS